MCKHHPICCNKGEKHLAWSESRRCNTGAPKSMPSNYWQCTVVPRNFVVNLAKSPVSALRAQWWFFCILPPNLANFPGDDYVSQTHDRGRFTIDLRSRSWLAWVSNTVDSCIHCAAGRHTPPQSATLDLVSKYSFLISLRVGGLVGLSTQWVGNLLRFKTFLFTVFYRWYSTNVHWLDSATCHFGHLNHLCCYILTFSCDNDETAVSRFRWTNSISVSCNRLLLCCVSCSDWRWWWHCWCCWSIWTHWSCRNSV